MKIKHTMYLMVICIGVSGLVCACIPSPPATPITDTPIPDTPVPEATPTKEAPSQPRDSAGDEPEIAPSNDSQLNETGPWLVYAAIDGIYAFNPDGSGFTKLDSIALDGLVVESITIAVPEKGSEIAVLRVDSQERLFLGMPRLRTFQLPNGALVYDSWLIPIDWNAEDYLTDGMSEQETKEHIEQIFAAIGLWNEIKWSHDGSMLAFNAALDGPSADLYLYDSKSLEITRLTDGPSQSVHPEFTPDDEYIVHGAVESLNWGYSGAGYNYLNAWAAKTDDTNVIKLFDHEFYGWETVVGWLTDTEYLAASWENWCYYFDLRVMDIFEGEQRNLYNGNFSTVAFGASPDKIFFTVPDFVEGGDCRVEFEHGAYLMDISDGEWVPLAGIDPEAVMTVSFNPATNAFFASSMNGTLFRVQPNGQVREYKTLDGYYETSISPDGEQWMFWDTFDDVATFGNSDGGYEQHTIEHPHSPAWLPDSSAVVFLGEQRGAPALYIAARPDMVPQALVTDIPAPYTNTMDLVLVNP